MPLLASIWLLSQIKALSQKYWGRVDVQMTPTGSHGLYIARIAGPKVLRQSLIQVWDICCS